MKVNTKRTVVFLIPFLMLTSLSSILLSVREAHNEQDDKNNKNNVPLLSASNSVAIEWNRTWGGSEDDSGSSVTVDSFNNVYLAGGTESFGAGLADMVLVKWNSSGVQLWNRTWGGNEADFGSSVAVDSFNNVYLAGGTNSFGAGSQDMVLVKYDSSGEQQWNHTWGGSEDEGVYGMEVAVDSLNNVYLAGGTHSFGAGSQDIVLVKYDSSGEQQWNRTWGRSSAEYTSGIVVDSLNNVYITGGSHIGGGSDSFDKVLVKYDSSGVQLWNRTWGGSIQISIRGLAVDSLDNVYIAAGTTTVGFEPPDMILVKCDSSGGQLWNHTWGGSSWEGGMEVAVDSFDSVYIAGWTDSFGAGLADMVLVKYGVEKREKALAISGYDLLLFTCVIGVITAISLIKKLKIDHNQDLQL